MVPFKAHYKAFFGYFIFTFILKWRLFSSSSSSITFLFSSLFAKNNPESSAARCCWCIHTLTSRSIWDREWRAPVLFGQAWPIGHSRGRVYIGFRAVTIAEGWSGKMGKCFFSPYGSPIIIYICVYLSTSVFIIWFMCAQHGPEFDIRDRSALAVPLCNEKEKVFV